MKFLELILIVTWCGVITSSQGTQTRNSRKRNNSKRQLPTHFEAEIPNVAGFNVDLHGTPGAVNLHFMEPPQRVQNSIDDYWNAFKTTFHKSYASPEEENYRRLIFIENSNKIFRMNDDYARGYSSFAHRINGYADMLHHEFSSALHGFNITRKEYNQNAVPTQRASAFIASANVQIPDAVDWRKLGAVTPVKSQRLCAGCYAFSAAGALEGHYYRKTGILNELSPQNLIDCTKEYGNMGCDGGLMDPVFQYVKDNNGIDTEASYAYEATTGQCRYKPEGFGADCTGFVSIPEGDEEALKVAVATLGPVSAAIDASRDSLQFYSDGVYFDGRCKNATEDMNHAVLIIGFDTDHDGKQFWLVKNSYGPEWGIGGYMKIARNAGNHCGIASIASYPLV